MTYDETFNLIKQVVPTVPGWCSVHKAMNMACLVFATRPALSFEIGVFAGRSLFALAAAHKCLEHGRAIGIDPWSSAESVKGQTSEHQKWWSNDTMHTNAEHIARNLGSNYKLGLYYETQKVASDHTGIPADIGVLHVDGNHSEQAERDVKRFAPAVSPGGFVVMDDLTWDNRGPERAAALLGPMGFKELYIVHNEDVRAKDDYGVYQRL